MVKITGIIAELQKIDECWLRVKASAPWIGVGTEIREFPVKNGYIDIELAPTPKDRCYLTAIASSPNSNIPFVQVESWTVPIEDCELTQIRNFSIAYVKKLEEENKELRRILNEAVGQLGRITSNNDTILSLANQAIKSTETNKFNSSLLSANNIDTLT